MRRIDGFLSRRAQRTWPGALVDCDAASNADWQLHRPGAADVGLGDRFDAATQALAALIAHHTHTTTEG